ncbi:hypothetical protein BTA51_23725 [Hahella sp. CCB-MM4]|uniref:hypothetical protein n=1 Tax=Hahella sp. (strain CCB-MM4) TaxID=1926491 RepID=UPI000B9C5218|nr:hypothetical protein [Hahella sp. CCB-MM4]OZG70851.1 hypothetical protein BTA51_23725 [Hahella sp. CCB-MM4]
MGRLVQSLTRVELWMVIGLIALIVVVFFRSLNSTINLVEEFKPEQVKSALEASLREIHITWLARGRPVGAGGEIEIGQQRLNVNDQGWPVAVGGESAHAEMTDHSCEEIFYALLTDYVAGELIPKGNAAAPKVGVVARGLEIRALAVGTVCVYQIGIGRQVGFSLLYNTASGEVRGATSGSAGQ